MRQRVCLIEAVALLLTLPIMGNADSVSLGTIAAPGAQLKKIAGGFAFTEGPASDSHGNIFFTDQPNDRILEWHAADGTITTFLQPCGHSNGLCFDVQGDLWSCADGRNALWRITASGKSTVVIAAYNGKLLNGPNDVWVCPDGGLYLTDPYYLRPYWDHSHQEQDVDGVYYLPPGGKSLTRVASDLEKPNGIIGTPDGKTLYVADIGADKTYVYTIAKNGSLLGKRLFCPLGSDGMTVDSAGNVYLTGHGVTVFDRSGTQIAHLPVPEGWTGNVCFGGIDRRTLFITATTSVYSVAMRVHGVGSQ